MFLQRTICPVRIIGILTLGMTSHFNEAALKCITELAQCMAIVSVAAAALESGPGAKMHFSSRRRSLAASSPRAVPDEAKNSKDINSAARARGGKTGREGKSFFPRSKEGKKRKLT